MVDLLSIPNRVLPPAASRPDGYQAAREIRALAAVSDKADSAEARKALTRLNEFLTSGQLLRPDVPRGYYLNFTI
jgi:hypothetical protein